MGLTMNSDLTSDTEPTSLDDDIDAAGIVVDELMKQFDTGQGIESVFKNVSYEIEPGSFVTLIGKSGSGKSTMLNILSGILEPTGGRVRFQKNGTKDADTQIGHVFQEPRLLPWETCVGNIEYVHEDNPDYTDDIAKQYLDLVGLSDHYQKYPSQLSGGQCQRVGITRAFSISPDVLIMDEPFSNLDEITAQQLRDELIDLWRRFEKTVFFVTHDITEAVQLSDRILMLGNGEIYQDVEVPLERPRDVDSAEFIQFRQEAIDKFYSVGEQT